MRPFLLAASLFCLAAPAGAQAAPAGVSDALFKQLLAALPHPEEFAFRAGPDPNQVARIGALNPGHEAEVRALLDERARCLDPVVHEGVLRSFRTIAGRLGPNKVRQLIAYYTSAEYRRLAPIRAAREKGQPVSPAQQREMDRYELDHPVGLEFGRELGNVSSILRSDDALQRKVQACEEATSAAFDRAKLRRN